MLSELDSMDEVKMRVIRTDRKNFVVEIKIQFNNRLKCKFRKLRH